MRDGKHSSSAFATAAQVVNRKAASRERAVKTKDRRIKLALKSIGEHTAGNTGDIAAQFNLSPSRFRHLFKEEVGISLRHYLKLVQLGQARELLENSFFRVKEVMALVGVNDKSHFTRDYKALYKQTPGQTRASGTGSLRSHK